MPDPLSTIFISSSHIGSDARESAGVSICQSFLHLEVYRWIPCGGPPSGSSSARRSICSKTPCSPVPARSGLDASRATTQTPLCLLNTQHSGLSPITPSSGSTCISQAHLKASLPPRLSPWMSLNQHVSFPNSPIPGMRLHAYLVHLRKKCQTTIAGLSDEQAHQQVDFPWIGGKPMSFLELLLYTMRHVQEHAAQLNLFLGQNASDGASDWVSRAKADEGGE